MFSKNTTEHVLSSQKILISLVSLNVNTSIFVWPI